MASPGQAKSLKTIWKLLKIDSPKLDALEIIPEINLLTNSTKSGKKVAAKNYLPELQDIKKEIIDENEGFVEFTNSLEVECRLCKEAFPAVDELLRHMNYSHQASKSTTDEIKYRRVRDGAESKGKGKGKGKKSFESRPIRKEIVEKQRSLSPTVVDDSQSNSPVPDLELETDEIQISDHEISFKPSDNEDSSNDIEKMDSNKAAEDNKRKERCDSNENEAEEEPLKKKTKIGSSLDVAEEVEDKLVWDDILCLYCDQNIPMVEESPAVNKKKYQMHLLSHFSDCQYSEIPENLRIYQCSYKDCSYAAADRSSFVHHLAFTHDEWYKRINKRIQEAMNDAEIAEELEDLSAIKEAFVTDHRIIVNGANAKPLWVDGTVDDKVENTLKKTEKPSEKPKDSEIKPRDTPYLQCHLCSKIMKTDSQNIVKNRNSYQIHLVEAHFENSMYSDISDQSSYKCSYPGCHFPATDIKSRLRIHLAVSHREFYQRLGTRLDKLKALSHKHKRLSESEKLKDILKFFKTDPRVLDENTPDIDSDGNIELKDDTTHAQICQTKIKEEKEDTNVVTIDEEFSTYLRNGQIKNEPQESSKDELIQKPENDKLDEKANSENVESTELKSKAKKKKKKKDLKHKKLRKTQQSESVEEDKTEEEKTSENNTDCTIDTSNTSDSREVKETDSIIIKLHEDVVNSQEIVLDDDADPNSESVDKSKVESEQDKAVDNEAPEENMETDKTESYDVDESEDQKEEARESELTHEYACRLCREEYDQRPDIIMHIITQHLEDKFGHIPDKVDEMYKCHHEECSYSSSRRHGLLAHLLLKHSVIKITEVTELMIHNEQNMETNENDDNPATDNVVRVEKIKEEPGKIEINHDDTVESSWKCKLCGSKFLLEDLAKQHVLLSHLQQEFEKLAPTHLKIFTCETCFKYSTVSRTSFIKHLGLVHQVVPDDQILQHIEHNKTLLLDIDVIKCKCGKKFDKEEHLRDHIIFTHLKQKFKHIKKGMKSYKCRLYHPRCSYESDSRISLIKHCIRAHQAVSDAEFSNFTNSVADEGDDVIPIDTESSVESVDDGIGFNDSVSQAANAHTAAAEDELTIIDIEQDGSNLETVPFHNNSSHNCPVCCKSVAQRSNFEDHLQTHAILNDPVFHCIECNFVTSFGQFYCHLPAVHKSSQISFVCLCCDKKFTCVNSSEAVQTLKTHCINRETRKIHRDNAEKFKSDLKKNLHSVFRY